MQITDPIADMLTRIRNAGTAKHETVDVPASNMKKAIAEILLNEGYIKAYQIVDDGTQGIIRITLKYLPGKEKAIQGLRRVSKPGVLFGNTFGDLGKRKSFILQLFLSAVRSGQLKKLRDHGRK